MASESCRPSCTEPGPRAERPRGEGLSWPSTGDQPAGYSGWRESMLIVTGPSLTR